MLSLLLATMSAVPTDPCSLALHGLAEAAGSHGYQGEVEAGWARATRGAVHLDARCDAGHLRLDLVAHRGAAVHVTVSADAAGYVLVLDASFPGVGQLSRVATFDEVDSAPWTGSLDFAARTGAAEAFAVFDLDEGTWSESGDIELVNTRFGATLRSPLRVLGSLPRA